ncbi:hypothetical protein AB0K74_47410 [Streptomyces sp. NPDC056159]|uniref:hypothetical protein n=1 Tax=Streptomyces sp. NPDC056159 TaxID=3155537 RepID=UPI00341342F1
MVALGNGVKYRAISVPANESQFLETIKATANQVAAIYGVPPEKVGGETGGKALEKLAGSSSVGRPGGCSRRRRSDARRAAAGPTSHTCPADEPRGAHPASDRAGTERGHATVPDHRQATGLTPARHTLHHRLRVRAHACHRPRPAPTRTSGSCHRGGRAGARACTGCAPALLDTYEDERLPVARTTLDTAMRSPAATRAGGPSSPNERWVADFTYVATWSDRRLVGRHQQARQARPRRPRHGPVAPRPGQHPRRSPARRDDRPDAAEREARMCTLP